MRLRICFITALAVVANLAAAEPVRRAVLVGVNIYKWSGAVHKDPALDFENLEGAAGDAIWLKSILTSKYGFRDDDVIVLPDAAATHEAIVDAFRTHLIAKSAPGDVALFYFAGHGSYREIGQGETESTLVPSDSRDPDGKVFDIWSSELHELFVALLEKTKNVTSILDSCHSDTAVRGGPNRAIKADNRPRPDTGMRTRGAIDLSAIAPVVRIAASQKDQESEETPDHKHGMMSLALFNELINATDQTTWREAMDRARTEVAKQNAGQDPQLEAANPDMKIFGGVGLAAKEPFLLVTPKARTVELNAGTMQGMASGTGLDVYPPGTREFTGTPIAKLTVTNVDDLTSAATVASGPAPKDIPIAARAVVRSRPASAFRFRIYFEAEVPIKGARQGSQAMPDAMLLDAVRKEALQGVVVGAELSPRKAADVVVRVADGSIHTERANGRELSPAVKVSDADAADHVVRQLAAWSRWHLLLNAQGGEAALELKIADTKGNAVSEVGDGAEIAVSVCNRGAQPYFARVVDFSSDGSITPLDLASDGEALAPGGCNPGGDFNLDVPKGRKSGVEIFKAFATLDKADMELFTGKAIRGDAPDPAKWSAVMRSVSVVKK